jgi:hypothetical protein
MGLWSTIAGWFGGTGVKALLWKYSEPLKKSAPVITGAVLLKSTKKDQTITAVEVRVVEEYTTTEGSGEDKTTETETTVLGSMKFPGHDAGIGYPLELKSGTQQEQPFTVTCTLTDRLQNKGGLLGKAGKAMSFMSGDKCEYYIIAEATVKGATFTVKDKHKLKVAD